MKKRILLIISLGLLGLTSCGKTSTDVSAEIEEFKQTENETIQQTENDTDVTEITEEPIPQTVEEEKSTVEETSTVEEKETNTVELQNKESNGFCEIRDGKYIWNIDFISFMSGIPYFHDYKQYGVAEVEAYFTEIMTSGHDIEVEKEYLALSYLVNYDETTSSLPKDEAKESLVYKYTKAFKKLGLTSSSSSESNSETASSSNSATSNSNSNSSNSSSGASNNNSGITSNNTSSSNTPTTATPQGVPEAELQAILQTTDSKALADYEDKNWDILTDEQKLAINQRYGELHSIDWSNVKDNGEDFSGLGGK